MLMWLVSLITISQAAVISTPENCFVAKKFPCIVLTKGKTTLDIPEGKLHLSSNALVSFSNPKEFHVVRGMIWGMSKQPVTLKTTFATFKTHQPTEYWMTAIKNVTTVRVFVGEMEVLPRGGKPSFVSPGKEVQVSYVDYNTRSCFVSNPSVIDMYSYVRDFSRVFPFGGASVEDHLNSVAATVLKASASDSQYLREHASRQLASSIERNARMKVEQERASRLEIYLRKLFRTKSNFEDQ